MTDIATIIKERRSIRAYKTDPVKKEDLQLCLEAIQWAPSWANTQCWEVVIIRDQAKKEILRDTLSDNNPGRPAMIQAPIVLAICGIKERAGYKRGEVTTQFGDWMLFDLGIATQNLGLQAHALGLGSLIIGLFDHAKVKEILNVPDNVDPVALIPLGYPEKVGLPPKRKEIGEFVREESY